MAFSFRNTAMIRLVRDVPAVAVALLVATLGVLWPGAAPVHGQRPAVHHLYRSDAPPGAIGKRQLQRGGPLRGYYQPVEVQAPRGARVSLAVDGAFQPSRLGPVKAGMMIGQVYRLRITQIPRNEGREVFPTIEVIDRLYPPAGKKTRFPIPIQLLREELEMALSGKYVTRVIYLEAPRGALPHQEDPETQRYYEITPEEDPLRVADQLGRPVAILRMGSRVPEEKGPSQAFLFGCPPFVSYQTVPDATVSQPPAQRRQPSRPVAAARFAPVGTLLPSATPTPPARQSQLSPLLRSPRTRAFTRVGDLTP